MAILEITATEVVQYCARCKQENRIPLAGLEAGLVSADDAPPDPRPVQLPPCPQCQSREFLIRSEDNEPEHPGQGSFGHLHKMLVDHLHSELVKGNKVPSRLRDQGGKADQRTAKPLPQAARTRWFPGGLKIQVPREAKEGAGPAAPGPSSPSGPTPPKTGTEPAPPKPPAPTE